MRRKPLYCSGTLSKISTTKIKLNSCSSCQRDPTRLFCMEKTVNSNESFCVSATIPNNSLTSQIQRDSILNALPGRRKFSGGVFFTLFQGAELVEKFFSDHNILLLTCSTPSDNISELSPKRRHENRG